MHEFFIFMVLLLAVVIAIVIIATHHVRKMAELENRKNDNGSTSRINALEAEVASLRQIVAEQAIALDDVSSMHRRLLDRAITDSGIRERLETK